MGAIAWGSDERYGSGADESTDRGLTSLRIGGACGPPPPFVAPLVPRCALTSGATPRVRAGRCRTAQMTRVARVPAWSNGSDDSRPPRCQACSNGSDDSRPPGCQACSYGSDDSGGSGATGGGRARPTLIGVRETAAHPWSGTRTRASLRVSPRMTGRDPSGRAIGIACLRWTAIDSRLRAGRINRCTRTVLVGCMHGATSRGQSSKSGCSATISSQYG
jgi:hypothetical protein